MSTQITYYDLLGVKSTASREEIRQAYKANIAKYHPDLNKAPNANQLAAMMNVAWETLSDPKRRAEYDRTIGLGGEGVSGHEHKHGAREGREGPEAERRRKDAEAESQRKKGGAARQRAAAEEGRKAAETAKPRQRALQIVLVAIGVTIAAIFIVQPSFRSQPAISGDISNLAAIPQRTMASSTWRGDGFCVGSIDELPVPPAAEITVGCSSAGSNGSSGRFMLTPKTQTLVETSSDWLDKNEVVYKPTAPGSVPTADKVTFRVGQRVPAPIIGNSASNAVGNIGYLGVYITPGTTLVNVVEHSPAADAGVDGGAILMVNGKAAKSGGDALRQVLEQSKPGDRIAIKVWGYVKQSSHYTITLGRRPAMSFFWPTVGPY